MFNVKRIHFVGIGGVGMCGIAEVLLNLGYPVGGSDLKESQSTSRLRSLGATVSIGHHAAHIEEASVVVYSSAVQADNPELAAARAAGIPVIPRAEMLAELMRLKYGIAVGGSHGKTTTTSMIATVLSTAGLDPTIVIGGRLNSIDSGAKLGTGRFLVAEADESDGSFSRLAPSYVVVTSIDREHMDHYHSLETLHQAFVDFANKVPFYGAVVLGLDNAGCREVLPSIERRVVTYGLAEDAYLRAERLEPLGFGSSFRLLAGGQELASVRLQVPGVHNVLNALAAAGVALQLEVPVSEIARGLESFAGVDRRFQLRGVVEDILLVDDYGHHPVEIQATLRAARGMQRRVLALFQPHRYSRTKDLFDEFAASFAEADYLGLLDIYPAGEKPLEGVSSAKLAEAIRGQGPRDAHHFASRDEAVRALCATAQSGDLILLLGAGDVNALVPDLLAGLAASREPAAKPNPPAPLPS
jgi:UDP-N-acetylmuramate--alanine ligase